jgi:hypothetical protein
MTIEIQGQEWTLVPDERYEVKFCHHETSNSAFGANKVYLHYSVIEPGPYFETKLIACYNARQLVGKPRKNGQFTLGKRSKLLSELIQLDPSANINNLSLERLKKVTLLVQTRTVTYDFRQRELPRQLHYSVVDQMISIACGDY